MADIRYIVHIYSVQWWVACVPIFIKKALKLWDFFVLQQMIRQTGQVRIPCWRRFRIYNIYFMKPMMFPEMHFKLRAKRNVLSEGGRWVQSHRDSHSLFHTSTSASNFAPFPMRYREIEQRGSRGSTCEWPKEMREAIWIEIRANLISMQMLTWL